MVERLPEFLEGVDVARESARLSRRV